MTSETGGHIRSEERIRSNQVRQILYFLSHEILF